MITTERKRQQSKGNWEKRKARLERMNAAIAARKPARVIVAMVKHVCVLCGGDCKPGIYRVCVKCAGRLRRKDMWA